MKKIFLTSGIVMCLACPAFAVDTGDNCDNQVLDGADGTNGNDTVAIEAGWNPNISGAINLVSSIYPNNNHNSTALYTGANNDGLTTATVTPLYSVYGVGMYTSQPTQADGQSPYTGMTAYTQLTTVPSKSGYTFGGFYTADGNTQVIDNTGAILNAAKTQVTTTAGTATWYADWTAKQYNISYNSGLHGSSTVTPDPVDPVTYTNGLTYDQTWTTKTFAENNFEADTGYTFSGWNTAQDGSGTAYAANTLQSPWQTDAALSLYAIYTANHYDVTYAEGTHGTGQGSVDSGGLTYDQAYSIRSLTNAGVSADAGYHFVNWSGSNGSTYGDEGTIAASTVSTNLTLTAQYAANVTTITYDCTMDNTVDGNSQSVYTGTAPSDGSATYGQNFAFAGNTGSCARTGWTFDGWTCKSGNDTLSVATLFGSGEGSLQAAAGTPATWAYTGANGGTIDCVAHYTANVITLNWYEDADAENPITLEANDPANSCTYDGTVTVPADPEKTGYTFTGWSIRQAAAPAQEQGN